jgi:hypothetical protein
MVKDRYLQSFKSGDGSGGFTAWLSPASTQGSSLVTPGRWRANAFCICIEAARNLRNRPSPQSFITHLFAQVTVNVS